VLTNIPEKNEILINLPILTSWRVHLKYLNDVFWLLFVYNKIWKIIIKKRVNKNPKKQFFSHEVSKTVLEWMESVVDKGSGSGVKIEGYRIAGKTGTSQKALNGSYTSKKVCSFVATLPVNDPKYAVLVVVDEPSKSYAYGSTVAVPVVKEIIESLIVIEKIPPNIKDHGMIVKKP